jgi:hypothetical protein
LRSGAPPAISQTSVDRNRGCCFKTENESGVINTWRLQEQDVFFAMDRDKFFFKNFPFFREKTKLQVRWEIYNLINHMQMSAVDNASWFHGADAQVSAHFGRVTAA